MNGSEVVPIVTRDSRTVEIQDIDENDKPEEINERETDPKGGLWGYAAVAGSWFALFCTFGFANAFGIFQSYYQFTGYPEYSASTISWIGSIQLFLQFSLGIVAGPLYDRGFFRALMTAGSIIYIVSVFMISLCTQFWQTLLAQGVGLGLGIGLLYLPSLSILSQYFVRRRSLAMGIAVTGSSVGTDSVGITLPIMLNNLIATRGFKQAVQSTGYLLLGCIVMANLLMRPRYKGSPLSTSRPSIRSLFDKTFIFTVMASFSVVWGLFFPIFYLQVYAKASKLDENIVRYTLAILNGASIFGRIVPNLLADHFGPFNLLIIMCAGSAVMCFALFGAGSAGGLITVAILFGFFQGAYASLLSPAVMATARTNSEIGTRVGYAFLITAFAALTGTPITGALLRRYGFYAPIVWSGVTVGAGTALLIAARAYQSRKKGTWKV